MLKLLKSETPVNLKVELLTASAKNWFLKRRLDTNLCQMLIDVKYMRNRQLGLKKNLKDLAVKSIIFKTHKNEVFR